MLTPGERFGRVTVVCRDAAKSSPGRAYYVLLCSCGFTWSARDDGLRSGAIQSCGCKKREHGFRHGHRRIGQKDPTYQSWDNMVQRCTNPKNPAYRHYGGRGISMPKRWKTFEVFLADMGVRPMGRSLERKNNEKGYSKANCTWATQAEQMQNTRRTLKFKWQGRLWTLSQLSAHYGIKRGTLHSRLTYLGWKINKALGFSCI